MSQITAVASTRTALTTTALNALASGAYVDAGTIDFTATDPLDAVIEISATPGTVAGNKQLLVFARVSLDGSNFSTGPVSGTTTTDEPNLRLLGALPLNTSATLQRACFSVVAALGYLPPHLQVVVKNETGAALASSGHAVHFATVLGAIS